MRGQVLIFIRSRRSVAHSKEREKLPSVGGVRVSCIGHLSETDSRMKAFYRQKIQLIEFSLFANFQTAKPTRTGDLCMNTKLKLPDSNQSNEEKKKPSKEKQRVLDTFLRRSCI